MRIFSRRVGRPRRTTRKPKARGWTSVTPVNAEKTSQEINSARPQWGAAAIPPAGVDFTDAVPVRRYHR
ncbi:hypothetical protein GCM10010168_77570 [Actinoplanes ianthinogenes]|uniref:Uncharacterized protein n=1 Tax=Actinoplanes ianthinogenes TaxID=122358 RepID=A0ABN6CV22_9ACTN|nr:hypothetical protein Aiant_89740 [Actinoplanes ianthinogenes]GGR47185.1 hypothetical protein GCM10010168_77570 [Actinoplanes ianthinogenes]